MKQIKYKNYICLVDHYRRPSRQRNTQGRYRVGAKNPKQAKELLQKAIGFGSIQVYYEDTKLLAKYKEVWKEVYNHNHKEYPFALQPTRHANEPISKK